MKTLLFTLLVSAPLWAQLPALEIKHLNFHYQAPLGEGSDETRQVSVEKIGNDFKILLTGEREQTVVFKDAPSFIRDAFVMKIVDLNLDLSHGIGLGLSSGHFQSPERALTLEDFTVNCEKGEVWVGCLKRLTLKAREFTSQGEGLDQAIMKAIDPGHDELKSYIGVRNIDLKITESKYDLSAELQAQVSGRVRSTGTMVYEAPLNKLTVKVSEVKFGFLDVTAKVFEELKKQESSKLKVSRPYLTFILK